MSAEVKSMKEWALYYAELGLAVFPLAYRNKVPAIEGGCKAATTEKSKIERWWNQNPRYNIGIATGNKSNGLVVIDLDVDKNKGIDGYEVLRDWQNKHGELPETWQSITGRGGYHYFYKDTITHSNKVGLYEGVDIRGEGGYIVAPPSVHPNGNTYEWEQEPKEYEIAQVDDIVNDFFKGEKQRIDSEHKTNFKVPELIPEGKRVDTIVRLIASLRTKGLDDDAIKAAVRVENEKRCNPPLKEKELEKAVFPALKRDWQVNSPSSIVEAQKTVSSSTGKMKTDAETNLAGVKKAAEDASGGVNTTTVTNWGNSASEVKKNLDKMKQTANLKLGEMQKTVESHFSGQYNTMTKKWEKACERIGQLITQMVRSTKDSLNGFTRNMNTIGNEMSNNLINGISGAVTGIAGILNEVVSKVNSTISNVNSSLSGIEKAFTFSYDVTTPDGKRRWGKYSMNLPRVNTVPYLAKGAVIPPRSEFLVSVFSVDKKCRYD